MISFLERLNLFLMNVICVVLVEAYLYVRHFQCDRHFESLQRRHKRLDR